MADAVLDRGVELGGADVQAPDRRTPGRSRNPARRAARAGCGRASGLRRSAARDRRPNAAARSRNGNARRAAHRRHRSSASQQLRDVRGRVAMRAGVARRNKPGAPPSASTQMPESSPSAGNPRHARRVPRLQQRVLDERRSRFRRHRRCRVRIARRARCRCRRARRGFRRACRDCRWRERCAARNRRSGAAPALRAASRKAR